jgi:methyl-accepting chemotaxis protein
VGKYNCRCTRSNISYINDLNKNLDTLKILIKKSGISNETISKFDLLISNYRSNFMQLVKCTDKISKIQEKSHKLVDEMGVTTEEITLEGHQMAGIDTANAIAIANTSSIILIIGMIITIIIGIIISVLISKSIRNPIVKLAAISTKISEGNLTIPIEIKRKDEIGDLANSFRIMIEALRQQLLEISSGSVQLSSAINEISVTSTQLSSSTTETSTSVTEISTTVEEIKQISQSTYKKATEVADKAQETAEVAEAGQDATKSTIEGINKINEEMSYIAQSTIKLGEQTQNIGEIINSVNSLADQTNLLSVNASIEAAKAGEYGKGFAVVAKEVKALAEQSREATKQISLILNEIQKATSNAVLATERGNKAVTSGLELSTLAGEAIIKLNENINESAEISAQIASSSQQELSGMEQLVDTMNTIKEALQDNVAGSTQLEESASALTQLGEKFKVLASSFKIEERENKLEEYLQEENKRTND